MSMTNKKSMFISFRDDPKDKQSIFEEIRLNVRRGLNHLKSTNIPSTQEITKEMNDLAIEEMTSNDLCNDLRAYYRTHECRLRDVVYTKKLFSAICCNAHIFKDKIVLDVSCDVGMSSMFSVIAGAKHVYAVDTSNIVQLTKRIIADNNLTDKITVIKGKVADITLPVDEVDIIVSTFFGQSLLCENRIDELIDAREKWLKPNGLILPNRCSLYLAAVNHSMLCDRSNFWTHVYKFDMRPMIKAVNTEPYLQHVKMDKIVTNTCPIKVFNMYTVKKGDYRQFDAPFCLESRFKANIGAFITYFDIEFTEGIQPIKFTCQPGMEITYWSQMVFFLSINDFMLDKDESFSGVFRFNALSDDYRKIDWNIEIMHKGIHGTFRENWNFQTK
ncbi:protein arginine N-methyltransferase 1-like [Contarinia nasturtii]|uniref:protein arginine N-methyltransferase 1-like n=1 Tax=Contarinia nasturtii TaxID=265458 RepID=UPI0012D41A9C|nr:protein arginine N-methyltransferase 1-like [Contarinia nasturtii]